MYIELYILWLLGAIIYFLGWVTGRTGKLYNTPPDTNLHDELKKLYAKNHDQRITDIREQQDKAQQN